MQHGTACGFCWLPLRCPISAVLLFAGVEQADLPFALGSPMEKRRAGFGTPVLRLMLNLRPLRLNMLAAAAHERQWEWRGQNRPFSLCTRRKKKHKNHSCVDVARELARSKVVRKRRLTGHHHHHLSISSVQPSLYPGSQLSYEWIRKPGPRSSYQVLRGGRGRKAATYFLTSQQTAHGWSSGLIMPHSHRLLASFPPFDVTSGDPGRSPDAGAEISPWTLGPRSPGS